VRVDSTLFIGLHHYYMCINLFSAISRQKDLFWKAQTNNWSEWLGYWSPEIAGKILYNNNHRNYIYIIPVKFQLKYPVISDEKYLKY
jgi:hypothetical protein